MEKPHISIVGAGIGGITLAGLLLKAGYSYSLYDGTTLREAEYEGHFLTACG